MEHRFMILPEKKLLLQNFSEKVSLENLKSALEHLIEDPLYDPKFNGLTIMMDAEVALTTAGVKQYSGWLKKMIQESNGLGKLALVVDKPSHTALSQIFQFELAGFQDIKVFNTYEGACDWLGLDKANTVHDITKLKKADPVLY